jgi:hypothetical protein
MKNKYRIDGDTVHLTVRAKGQGLEYMLDAADLGVISEYTGWWVNGNGYAYTYVRPSDGRQRNIMMHRMLTYAEPHEAVDHINGDIRDNRLTNLRLASLAENSYNRTKKFVGVHWAKDRRKWVAMASVRDRTKYIGSFDEFAAAGHAVCDFIESLDYIAGQNRRKTLLLDPRMEFQS